MAFTTYFVQLSKYAYIGPRRESAYGVISAQLTHINKQELVELQPLAVRRHAPFSLSLISLC